MKQQPGKAPDLNHLDPMKFIRSCSAAEIFESQAHSKTNRENHPPRSRNHESKQLIKLDAIFGDYDSQSTVLRER